MGERNVWFKLYEQFGGAEEPIDHTSDMIKMRKDALIVDFRNAVFDKRKEGENIVRPTDLSVHSSNLETVRTDLSEDDTLSAYGVRPKQPLIVVIHRPAQTEKGGFDGAGAQSGGKRGRATAASGGDGGAGGQAGGKRGRATAASDPVLVLLQKVHSTTEHLSALFQASQTQARVMSKVSENFASPLLKALGYDWKTAPVDCVSSEGFAKFSWYPSEPQRTPAAVKELEKRLALKAINSDHRQVEILDFSRKDLKPIKADHKKVEGCTDAVIRLVDSTQDDAGAEYVFALGVVQFETDKAPIQKFQNLCELVSLATASEFGEAVVHLGTDLNSKWEIMHFDKPHHITIQKFENGPRAISVFKDLLRRVKARKTALDGRAAIMSNGLAGNSSTATLGRGAGSELRSQEESADVQGVLTRATRRKCDNKGSQMHSSRANPLALAFNEDQDLDGFDVPSDPVADRLQFIQNFVNIINDRYNANVTLPRSAYATRVPDNIAHMYV